MNLQRYPKNYILQLFFIGIITLILIFTLPQTTKFYRIDFILSAIITCASTFTGFLTTAISILFGFSRSALLQYLNKKGGTKELIIRCAITLLLGLVLLTIAIVVGCDIDGTYLVKKIWIIILSDISILFVINLFMSGYYMIKTISLATNSVVYPDEDKVEPKGEYRI